MVLSRLIAATCMLCCWISGARAQERVSISVYIPYCTSLDSAALERATYRLEPEAPGNSSIGARYDVRVDGQEVVLIRVVGQERRVLRREPTSTGCETLLPLLSALIALDRGAGSPGEPEPESPPATSATSATSATDAEPSIASSETADGLPSPNEGAVSQGEAPSAEATAANSSNLVRRAEGRASESERPREAAPRTSFLAIAPRLEVAAGVLVDIFALPSPSPAVFGSIGVGLGSLSVDVRFVATTDRQDPLPDDLLRVDGWVEVPGPTDLDTYALHARACVAARFGVRGCVGVGTTLYRLREFNGYPLAFEHTAFNPTVDAIFSLSYRNARLIPLGDRTGLGFDIGVNVIPHLVRPHFIKDFPLLPDRAFLPRPANVQVHIGLVLATQ